MVQTVSKNAAAVQTKHVSKFRVAVITGVRKDTTGNFAGSDVATVLIIHVARRIDIVIKAVCMDFMGCYARNYVATVLLACVNKAPASV